MLPLILSVYFVRQFQVRQFPILPFLVHHFPVRQFLVQHFPVRQFPPLQLRPSLSSPALSTPAISRPSVGSPSVSTPATSSVICQSCIFHRIHPLLLWSSVIFQSGKFKLPKLPNGADARWIRWHHILNVNEAVDIAVPEPINYFKLAIASRRAVLSTVYR